MPTPTHITTSGGLISAAFVEHIREPAARQRGIELESFALPGIEPPQGPAGLEDKIATAWELLLERWDAVRAELPAMDVSQLRNRWLLPLFQLLDFDPAYQRGDTVLDEAGRLRYPLSHRGWEGPDAPVLHSVPPAQDLDERAGPGRGTSTSSVRGIKAKSPHDMLQAFLNASPADAWALLSNGILLRLLRDYHHTFTKGYVQFDLESILETRNYGDFRALYRMAHASRFVAPPAAGDEEALCPLEQFYKDSLATGIKVGEDLRGQVRQAIEVLGNGFLDGALIQRLQGDPEACRDYYGQILRVIYRLLFLLFAEQRGLLPHAGAPLEDLYRDAYSITALRGRAEGDIPREDRFSDLWEGLQVTFRMVREGAPELGVFGYDGMLFEEESGSLLQGRACRNGDLLRATRALTLIEREGVLQRISYADLGVEELGSIYESLLDFTPRVTAGPEEVEGRTIPPHTFFLDPRGAARKTTGSYYTHPSLVNELIKSALLPVARDRLSAANLPVIAEEEIGEATAGLLSDYTGLDEAQRRAGERALLALQVCDPAAGSGHFLVKANNTLGAELARLRTGDDYPTEAAVQAAKRDVLAHCIYAVDLNPMAVELCKVSLWINASVRDRPLSFLDHHIKCGNSLIGATPELLEEGVPYEAFDQTIVGNHRATANRIRRRNRKERRAYEKGGAYQMRLPREVLADERAVYRHWSELADLAEERPREARERYAAYRTRAEYRRRKLEADCWTAAFFWPLPQDVGWVPTFEEFLRLRREGPEALPPEALLQIERLAERYRFFHWYLEFPEVFAPSPPSPRPPSPSPKNGERGKGVPPPRSSERAAAGVGGEGNSGGFDVVLGNPPWERIKLQEKEFFAGRDSGEARAIANARTAAARRRLIKELPQTDPALHAAYNEALRESEAASHFLRESGRYPLTGVGDVNTYAVFTGLAREVIAPTGRAGLVVPSGIATDYTYRDFFADVMEQGSLVSLYDFENREGLFPGTHRSYKFSLLTLTTGGVPEADFAFFLHRTDELAGPERTFTLSGADLALINPNTRTCPVFRSRRDAELTRKIYRAVPVLVNEETGEDPWGIRLWTMFHMANDSHLFQRHEQLEAQQYTLVGNFFRKGKESYLPLYEAKMFQQYDHRAANVEEDSSRMFRSGQPDIVSTQEHTVANFTLIPRYWVSKESAVNALPPQHSAQWLFGYKNVTSPTNERTFIGTILPFVAAGHSIQFISSAYSVTNICALVGNLNALVFDFVAKRKLGGINFSYFVLKQLPVLPPNTYSPTLLSSIVPPVLELTYTAWDLQAFADDVWREADGELQAAIERQWQENAAETGGHVGAEPPAWAAPPPPLPSSLRLRGEGQGGVGEGEGGRGEGVRDGFPHPPFKWDEERRLRLRCELDALYAHLYGLTREELDYILETFPIVRRKDEERYGEYRTKRLVLEGYERHGLGHGYTD